MGFIFITGNDFTQFQRLIYHNFLNHSPLDIMVHFLFSAILYLLFNMVAASHMQLLSL